MEFCTVQNKDPTLENLSVDVIYELVRKFLSLVRTRTGEMFKQSSYRVAQWTVGKYVLDKVGVNINMDPKLSAAIQMVNYNKLLSGLDLIIFLGWEQ